MDLLCFCSVFCMLCLCALLFICALWSPAGKGLTSWLSLVVSNGKFITFPLVSWVRCGQVWYLIVSIPDLCTLTYFVRNVYLSNELFSLSFHRLIVVVQLHRLGSVSIILTVEH